MSSSVMGPAVIPSGGAVDKRRYSWNSLLEATDVPMIVNILVDSKPTRNAIADHRRQSQKLTGEGRDEDFDEVPERLGGS